jgi:hypothetical protein
MNERQLFAYRNPINHGEPTDLYVRDEACTVGGAEAELSSTLYCSRESETFDGRPYWAVCCSVRNAGGQALISGFKYADLKKIYEFCAGQLDGCGLADETWQLLAIDQITATLARAMTDEEIAGRGSEWGRIEVEECDWNGGVVEEENLPKEEVCRIADGAFEFMRGYVGPVRIEMDISTAAMLIGQLQLAFRHPANQSYSRKQIEDFTRDWIERIDPERGAFYRMMMMGFDAESGDRKISNDAPGINQSSSEMR